MIQQFTLETPGLVKAGAGSIAQLDEMLSGIKEKDAILLTDKGVRAAGLSDSIIHNLSTAGWSVFVVDSVEREPNVQNANSIIEECRKHACGVIIGVGGGSVLDTAKILGCLLKTGETLDAVIDSAQALHRSTPTCLIPTTAGTGSEATKNAIFALPEKKMKAAVISSELLPDYVILDPELTLSLPPQVTASTGLDALAHALECYTSRKATPLSDLLALEAIKRISRSLKKVFANGQDVDARTDLLFASFYAGMCITLSGTTAVHALSYPMGALFHIPHGVANAMLLAPVIDFNKDAVNEKLYEAVPYFGLEKKQSIDETVTSLIEWIYGFVSELKIPTNLVHFGIKHQDIDDLVEGAIETKRLLDNNAKPMTKAQIRSIYEQIQ
ncbi:iron-containing alcohol dehydrogenase [Sediminispirochaeta bajacaliforniensis]|uniref:iron-containing alcohol dehydrogenase n=1 Tax=Sediminispirochaeta bajacaliforniensis TaxID=148 RepID=UPI0003647DDE|nr:iron-containing alcohol dehydrogenase [Sediminispirochaeta bajacaliforniensis]